MVSHFKIATIKLFWFGNPLLQQVKRHGEFYVENNKKFTHLVTLSETNMVINIIEQRQNIDPRHF